MNKKLLLRWLLVLGFGLVLLVGVLFITALQTTSKQVDAPQPAVAVTLDQDQMAARLARGLQFRTISYSDETQFDGTPFLELREYIEQSFPRVHAALTQEIIDDYSLLYTWPGQDAQLQPMLLMAHLDVVPVETGTETAWTYPPFDGRIAEGYIWGRGAMDDKSSVFAILEAAESLLQEGFQPQRTIYLAFGHDEEIYGQGGAAEIAALLHSRGIELDYVLDEGGGIAEDTVPYLTQPAAVVGIAEKGFANIELSVQTQGGHSSSPPSHTAVGILSTAIHKLESNPYPLRISAPSAATFEYLAPEMPGVMRLVFANRWLFGGLIRNQLAQAPRTNAEIRTTMAATIFESGTKENILPSSARAVLNWRILPGDSIAGVMEHVRQTIDDPQVKIRLLEVHSEPSPVSDIDSPSFEMLQRTIRQTFPDVVVLPTLTVGTSDARHYGGLTRHIYRFAPIVAGPEDANRAHGTDERLSVENYGLFAQFYVQLIRNSSS
jgi:carboxypeptidase PM20D1